MANLAFAMLCSAGEATASEARMIRGVKASPRAVMSSNEVARVMMTSIRNDGCVAAVFETAASVLVS